MTPKMLNNPTISDVTQDSSTVALGTFLTHPSMRLIVCKTRAILPVVQYTKKSKMKRFVGCLISDIISSMQTSLAMNAQVYWSSGSHEEQ